MITLNNDEGRFAFISSDSIVFDEVLYEDGYHFDIYSDVEGISLERINPAVSGLDENNWFSASEASGFGTPTSANSNQAESVSNNNFLLNLEAISPDGDGFNDFALLNYEGLELGTTTTISVFNHRGFFLYHEFNNFSLNNEGLLIIDGIRDNGLVLNPGIYVLLIETFNTNGKVEQEKMSLTVVGELR